MKLRTIALLCAAALLLTLCACGADGKKAPADDGTAAPSGDAAGNDASGAAEGTPAADLGGWTWTKGELDCYGYSTGGADCYMSFSYPAQFKTAEENESGEQYRGFYYNPDDPDADANHSPYAIYVYFLQGGYGPRKDSFDEQALNGMSERELGGRTVLFGELPSDENTGAHAFVYYTSYSDDDYARIWFLVCDPEADGAFRQTFEQSVSFTAEA